MLASPGRIRATRRPRTVRPRTRRSPAGQSTHRLKCTGFGFNVPAGNGVTSEQLRWKYWGDSSITTTSVQLVQDGVPQGYTKVIADRPPPASDDWVDFGTGWGLSPTAAQVNSAGFGAVISFTGGSGALHVDAAELTVCYAPSPPTPTPTQTAHRPTAQTPSAQQPRAGTSTSPTGTPHRRQTPTSTATARDADGHADHGDAHAHGAPQHTDLTRRNADASNTHKHRHCDGNFHGHPDADSNADRHTDTARRQPPTDTPTATPTATPTPRRRTCPTTATERLQALRRDADHDSNCNRDAHGRNTLTVTRPDATDLDGDAN